MTSSMAARVAERYARGTAIAAVVIAVVWHVTNDTASLIVGWGDYREPAISVVAWIAYGLIAVAGGFAVLRDRPMRRTVWPLTVGSLALVPAVALDCTGDLISPANWAWGATGWLGVLLMWHRRAPLLVMFVGLSAALSLAALFAAGQTDRLSLARYAMVVVGSAALQLGFALAARALRAAAQWTADVAAARTQTMRERAQADAIHAARHQRYETLQRTAAHLLAALADGSAAPGDPRIQRKCAAEAARLRRLFVETDDLPDPLIYELRACADIAEQRGVLVDLATVGETPPVPVEVRRELAHAPIHVLSAARTTARITLLGTRDHVTVSVIADGDADEPDPAAVESVSTAWVREAGRLWIETRWNVPDLEDLSSGGRQPERSDRTTLGLRRLLGSVARVADVGRRQRNRVGR